MKYSTKQVNGTEWAVVVKNSAGEFGLVTIVGSSHVASVIAQNENRAQYGRTSDAQVLEDEIRFHTLPRVVSRISKRGNKVWTVAA